MRCPECREGIMYKCRAKMNNGETITVISCDEQWCSWADEVCLETEIDFHRLHGSSRAKSMPFRC